MIEKSAAKPKGKKSKSESLTYPPELVVKTMAHGRVESVKTAKKVFAQDLIEDESFATPDELAKFMKNNDLENPEALTTEQIRTKRAKMIAFQADQMASFYDDQFSELPDKIEAFSELADGINSDVMRSWEEWQRADRKLKKYRMFHLVQFGPEKKRHLELLVASIQARIKYLEHFQTAATQIIDEGRLTYWNRRHFLKIIVLAAIGSQLPAATRVEHEDEEPPSLPPENVTHPQEDKVNKVTADKLEYATPKLWYEGLSEYYSKNFESLSLVQRGIINQMNDLATAGAQLAIIEGIMDEWQPEQGEYNYIWPHLNREAKKAFLILISRNNGFANLRLSYDNIELLSDESEAYQDPISGKVFTSFYCTHKSAQFRRLLGYYDETDKLVNHDFLLPVFVVYLEAIDDGQYDHEIPAIYCGDINNLRNGQFDIDTDFFFLDPQLPTEEGKDYPIVDLSELLGLLKPGETADYREVGICPPWAMRFYEERNSSTIDYSRSDNFQKVIIKKDDTLPRNLTAREAKLLGYLKSDSSLRGLLFDKQSFDYEFTELIEVAKVGARFGLITPETIRIAMAENIFIQLGFIQEKVDQIYATVVENYVE